MLDEGQRARRVFWALWTLVLAIKLVIAAWLPPFVDEVFYWQEGRHPAFAYSDLPGLTAWLARLGTELGGDHRLALRLPFLAIAALLPWMLARIARREFGDSAGWRTGQLALLLPLLGTLGLLALPDVPMALATALCIDAGARLLRRISAPAALELGIGLAIGALSHYRFLGVIAVGFVALLALKEGRRLLGHAWVWTAIAMGAVGWAPLILWNVQNADAGLRFQLVDRHPWAFHAEGFWFLLVQAVVVTPLLWFALLQAGVRSLAPAQGGARPVTGYLAALGMLTVAGFFVLGFFADSERVSFHWPLPGYLALLLLAPLAMARWRRGWRTATRVLAGAGLAIALAAYAAVSFPTLRAPMASYKLYPSNFAGWGALADAVRRMHAQMPPTTRLLADNFKVGAQVGFALGDPDIPVLDHPLNHKHGRAPQLRLWGLQREDGGDRERAPVLLVAGLGDVRDRDLPAYYHSLCARIGPLPAPRIVQIDHGRQRFALFRFDGGLGGEGDCTAPAMAWVDSPRAGAVVPRTFEVRGWAFRDGVGLDRVEITLDGRPVALAAYGLVERGPIARWPFSNDPHHPRVGFRAKVTLPPDTPSGRHWLGLRLHGADGAVEPWPEAPIEVRAPAADPAD